MPIALGSLLNFITVALIALTIFLGKAPNEGLINSVYILILLTQSVLLLGFSSQIKLMIESKYNFLLPGFNRSIIFIILGILFSSTLLPLIMLHAISSIDVAIMFNILLSGIVCCVLSLYSQGLSALTFLFLISWFSVETVHAQTDSNYQPFDNLGFNVNILVGFLIAFLVLLTYMKLYVRQLRLKSEVLKPSTLQLKQKKKQRFYFAPQIMLWISSKLGIENNLKVDIAFLSKSISTNDKIKIILFTFFSIDYLFELQLTYNFFYDFVEGLGAKHQSVQSIFMAALLVIAASFDINYFERMSSAKRFCWLRLPVSGISQFNSTLGKKFFRAITVELIVTTLIIFMAVKMLKLSDDQIIYCMLSFFVIKLYSLLWAVLASHLPVGKIGIAIYILILMIATFFWVIKPIALTIHSIVLFLSLISLFIISTSYAVKVMIFSNTKMYIK
ncbi:hypothetical protein [Pleionea sediminis]|uniref:hypothetical protein n=1 Tax=Pleionea sediminis TaxID=2569479 RepID=UPI001184F95B|nr:hypothetical protein [Pleionea sediminis]